MIYNRIIIALFLDFVKGFFKKDFYFINKIYRVKINLCILYFGMPSEVNIELVYCLFFGTFLACIYERIQ